MLLSDFLNFFDFDYAVVNGQIRLIDTQGANLGGIDQDRFDFTSQGKSALVDRLEIYINDYIVTELVEKLEEIGIKDISEMSLSQLAQSMKDNNLSYPEEMVDVILNSDKLEFDLSIVHSSFTVGQMFKENDTNKIIELSVPVTFEDILKGWTYKVYDEELNHLYTSSDSSINLAKAICNEYMTSITSFSKLRMEPGMIYFNRRKNMWCELELNDYTYNRFSDISRDIHGELVSAQFYYDIGSDSSFFKLCYYEEPSVENRHGYSQYIETSAYPEEQESLLNEMKYEKPQIFEKINESKDYHSPDIPSSQETIEAVNSQAVEPQNKEIENSKVVELTPDMVKEIKERIEKALSSLNDVVEVIDAVECLNHSNPDISARLITAEQIISDVLTDLTNERVIEPISGVRKALNSIIASASQRASTQSNRGVENKDKSFTL